MSVTPFVGVWIETQVTRQEIDNNYVTPFVGVWIETAGSATRHTPREVTPFVGVWIETITVCRISTSMQGHTLRGCVD